MFSFSRFPFHFHVSNGCDPYCHQCSGMEKKVRIFVFTIVRIDGNPIKFHAFDISLLKFVGIYFFFHATILNLLVILC